MGILSLISAHKGVSALIAVAIVLFAVGTFMRIKKVAPVSWGWFGMVNSASGVALNGYDVMAYHTDGRPALGDPSHTVRWNGVEWRFRSAESLARFETDPEAYAPRFGGFCSFAVSKGFTANANPEVWHIEDGRLYVFDSESVKEKWVAQIGDGVVPATEASWARR